ncbi:MAG: LLM class flavin-dependent oxidoreductase [Myxococcales bacterium]|nr:LLM class flavin-dependent oxidoreductase [Myxococcales bacterium]MCB9582597.1 LLM class flavin-dependent oxidoreductase [Polyangiaceae bacterium]
MVTLSALDLAPIVEGSNVATALQNTATLARHVEQLGFRRYWLAEHHNMSGIASAATSVVIGHVGAATSSLRIGAGGIMLPNHAPLLIAEQFGTLEALFPGRIDLGLGRAPGTDPVTMRALRRTLAGSVDSFPDDVLELMAYFEGEAAPVRAVPGMGANVEVWMLGSSTYGASLAAALGLPYAFASHFAPAQLDAAIEAYKGRFRPSQRLAEPHLMLGVNAIVADSESEARWMATSLAQTFLRLRRGNPGPLPPPLAGFLESLAGPDLALLESVLSCSFVGTPQRVAQDLAAFAERTGADELMVVCNVFDFDKRLRSYELLAKAMA